MGPSWYQADMELLMQDRNKTYSYRDKEMYLMDKSLWPFTNLDLEESCKKSTMKWGTFSENIKTTL